MLTLIRAAKRESALNRYACIRYDVRAGRLNMYRPDGALIVHSRRICIRASVRTERSEDATACRALRRSERSRFATIYARGTDGMSSTWSYRPFVWSVRAFRKLRPSPHGLVVTKGI